jgi:hypothetical protein
MRDYIFGNTSLKGKDIYGSDRDTSENLIANPLYAFIVGPTTRAMGSRGDRVGSLTVKEPFKVTTLRFSSASLSDPFPN